MKLCSMKIVIWITTTIFSTQTEARVVIYGQLGDTVMLPNEQRSREVRWTREPGRRALLTMLSNSVPSIDPEMIGRVSLSGYSLVLKDLKLEDFTVFKCHLSNYESKEYQLYQIKVSAVSATVLATQDLSLSCTVPKSDVSTIISWSDPQDQKAEGSRFRLGEHTLTVLNVSARDHGKWTCIVTYGTSKATATLFATVVDISPSPPQPLYTSLSSSSPSLLLPCSLHTRFDSSTLGSVGLKAGHWSFAPFPWDAAPEGPQKLLDLSLGPRLRWVTPSGQRLNGTALETDADRTNLSISRKVEEGGGLYTCTLEFNSGVTLSRTLRVEVLRIVSSPGNPALEGQGLNLTCTLGPSSLLRGLELKWSVPRQSSLSPLPASPHRPLQGIPRVSEKDKGIWKCDLLKDDKVLATATLNLRTERVPVDAWLVVSVCGAAVVLFLLLALVFLCVRRHRQKMFMRRRRKTKYCRCKHPQVKGFYRS
ncbi:CD4-1 molecule isoform X2 [Conger conger]|uniref:CD4-1 molecule isoform X2 n=1 Tax=Conger conger TaxID=82655 RepID=UPI002A5AEE86|nr:CD4-1 molecule isoform X2 [Conger conger]